MNGDTGKVCSRVFAACFILLMQFCAVSEAEIVRSRKLTIGQMLPEFTVVDSSGQKYHRTGETKRALLAVFFSAGQTRSVHAAEEIKNILLKLGSSTKDLDLLFIFNDPNDPLCQSSQWKGIPTDIHIVVDRDLSLWGNFGLIVMPSALICGKDNHLVWIESGYGYNFEPVVHARLNQVLGIAQDISPDKAGEVKAVVNDTLNARIQRHVQMAKLLESRGQYQMALEEIQKCRQLDPNSIDVTMELAELYCRNSKATEAINLLGSVTGETPKAKAKIAMILGWAHRLKGSMETAEQFLLEAIKLNPRSIRALYELGQVYQTKGDLNRAVTVYKQALQLALDNSQ